jgi:2-polyprenyl-3-methyl-5-hydroxy-6-metoxy-1,4-benzoquinol methylase
MGYLKEMAEQGYNPQSIGSFHQCMIPWLLTEYNVNTTATILDIGAAQGHCLIPLHENGYQQLIALDIDNYNFKLFNSYGFKTLKCNIESEEINLEDNSVDAIICFHLIEHLNTPKNFLDESYRVLKNHGLLFLVTPDWRKQYKTFWKDPTHLRPSDKESIARLFRMHEFSIRLVSSWSPAFGFGRTKAYKWWLKLGMIGRDLMIVGEKIIGKG